MFRGSWVCCCSIMKEVLDCRRPLWPSVCSHSSVRLPFIPFICTFSGVGWWCSDPETCLESKQTHVVVVVLFFYVRGKNVYDLMSNFSPDLSLKHVLSSKLMQKVEKKISNVCFVAISELPVFDFSWFSFFFFQWHCLFMGSVLCTVGRYSRCGAAPLCMPYMLVFSQNVRSDFVKEEIPRPSSWSSDASSLKVY